MRYLLIVQVRRGRQAGSPQVGGAAGFSPYFSGCVVMKWSKRTSGGEAQALREPRPTHAREGELTHTGSGPGRRYVYLRAITEKQKVRFGRSLLPGKKHAKQSQEDSD